MICPSIVVEGTYTNAPGGLSASVAASKVDSWAPATTLKSTVHNATNCQAAILCGRGLIQVTQQVGTSDAMRLAVQRIEQSNALVSQNCRTIHYVQINY